VQQKLLLKSPKWQDKQLRQLRLHKNLVTVDTSYGHSPQNMPVCKQFNDSRIFHLARDRSGADYNGICL